MVLFVGELTPETEKTEKSPDAIIVKVLSLQRLFFLFLKYLLSLSYSSAVEVSVSTGSVVVIIGSVTDSGAASVFGFSALASS